MEGDELREAVELWKVSWRVLERAMEEWIDEVENVIAAGTLPASVIAELRAWEREFREAWERELELHRCDMAMIFRRDRV